MPCLDVSPQAPAEHKAATHKAANLDGGSRMGLNYPPWMAGVAQLVERQVVVLDAVGSSPIARPNPSPAGPSLADPSLADPLFATRTLLTP